ncbi:hypothetical protein E2553_39975 [Paraburkholderia dipogonis]|uniref:Uncharacterized protein n=1 Tax=Paraburkholderia dipogonis TaxID=1211383 RepID=A0A4Y8MJJ5_9BURK|nr:hypothetical protein [Paraburkholderia dipogonis]TFE37602.1 hypothetical protein E2553_39975 [Paraburkholderia dipogonis]
MHDVKKRKEVSRAQSFRVGNHLLARQWRNVAASCICALFATGCSIPTGPTPIMTANWMAPPSATAAAPAQASAPIPASAAPAVASGMGLLADKFNAAAAVSLNTPTDQSSAHTMLEAGFLLIYASCWDYFRSAGQKQHWIIVANDYVAAAGTLATSILALTHAGSAAVTATALVTSTFVAGTSIYTKDFLFAAENIDSVRTLTLNALVTHQNKVRTDPGALTGYTALVAIMDDQEICTIPQITTLVRQAITTAKPNGTDNNGNPLNSNGGTLNFTSVIDKSALTAISGFFSPIQPLADNQVVALFWYLFGSPNQQDKDGPICQQLATLPPNLGPVQAVKTGATAGCTYYSPWPQEALVKQLFNGLSPAAVATLQQATDKLKQGGGATTPTQSPQTPGNANGQNAVPSKHININVLQ